MQALLDEVSAPLAGRVRNRPYRFEVAALAGPEPNAFALPGGYIFVAPALVELAGHGRDERAFIVAHEMAHVIRRHAIDRILSQRALQAVTLASPAARSIAPWRWCADSARWASSGRHVDHCDRRRVMISM